MARPKREDYPGAMHHVFFRGVARSPIALDIADYEHELFLLERTVSGFDLRCHAWCYLPNHAHLLITSELGNLSRAMHWLGTCAGQSFNGRHMLSGHVYQARFGSRLVEDEGYLLELARYLPLNPVHAGLCDSPEEWQWSSYAATVGRRPAPWFLSSNAFLDAFDSTAAYEEWVAQGVDPERLDERGLPISARSAPPLATLLMTRDLDDAIACAHFDHGYSQAEIARHLHASTSQVSRRLARHRLRATGH
jgi:REP element-mobilizing transposase RayT